MKPAKSSPKKSNEYIQHNINNNNNQKKSMKTSYEKIATFIQKETKYKKPNYTNFTEEKEKRKKNEKPNKININQNNIEQKSSIYLNEMIEWCENFLIKQKSLDISRLFLMKQRIGIYIYIKNKITNINFRTIKIRKMFYKKRNKRFRTII